MNTCPVYRRSGGHSYQFTVPGPIGSVLAPARNAKEHYTLPYASSLCGSCTDVCPVKIDLHHQLLAWRGELAAARVLPWPKRFAMKVASGVLKRTWLYRLAGRIGRFSLRWLPRWLIYNQLNPWGKQRELPPMPRKSFRQLYRRRRKSR
jgi:L-lactate dehydrogenase complex protein LldF